MKVAKTALNTPVKRNIYIAGKRTSLQLETYIWDCVDSVLEQASLSLSMLCTELKMRCGRLRMAQSLRLFALIYFRTMAGTMDQTDGQTDLLRSPPAVKFNVLIETLQILSQHAPRD